RVFAVEVELQGRSSNGSSISGAPEQLTVSLVVPGAQVIPSELTLEHSGRVRFYVNPLVRGPLRNAHLDISHHGHHVDEVRLPINAVTHRLTWSLAFLTLLVPAFFLYTTKANRLSGTTVRIMPQPEDLGFGIGTGPPTRSPTKPVDARKAAVGANTGGQEQ